MIVPHAAQKTEKKVGDASYWMKKKIDKREQTNNYQRRRRQKIQDRVHPFFFFCNAYLSCENNFILYENRKYIYFHTSLAPP